MKTLWKGIGTALFWGLWPIWYGYFKVFPERSRVLVVVNNEEVLVVRSWLGPARFGLPGGGRKRHETSVAAAVRELKEEAGIDVPESSLVDLGKRTHKENGLKYKTTHFLLRLPERLPVYASWLEISDVQWMSLESIDTANLSKDAKFALRRHVPIEQKTLL